MAPQLHLCLGRRIVSVSRKHTNTHTHTHTHLVWLLCAKDQHNKHKRRTSMYPAGFEPAIPASEGLQTPRLRPHGHQDPLFPRYTHQNRKSTTALSCLNAADWVDRLCTLHSCRCVLSARLSTARFRVATCCHVWPWTKSLFSAIQTRFNTKRSRFSCGGNGKMVRNSCSIISVKSLEICKEEHHPFL